MIWDQQKRRLVEDTPSMDIRAFARDGWIKQGMTYFVWGLDTFELDWTAQRLGGERPWFLCPGCSRRCALLYSVSGGHYSCRRCCKLAYASENETELARRVRRWKAMKAHLVEDRSGLSTKPKHLHWRTFWRNQQKLLNSEAQVAQMVVAKFR
jgi:hypothetical protein